LNHLNAFDYTVLVSYVLMVICVGLGAVWYQKRKSAAAGEVMGEGSYFLAARKLPWPIIGLSLFSTNISTVHIVSLCEQGYKTGLVYANFELAAVFTLVILAVFFVPFYIRANVTTLPDFLEKRFSRSCRDFLAIISIVSAIFIHIGTSLYAGAVVINAMVGVPIDTPHLMPTIIMIVVATGIYVVVGGLLSVTLTDSIQTTTLLIGSAVVTWFAYTRLGGWHELQNAVGPNMTSVLRSGDDFSKMPWYAVLVGYPVIGIWYWCTDQTIVQRVLGAKTEDHGKAGALFAGFLKLLPMFIFVLPGLLCLALVTTGKIAPPPNTKNVYAHLVMTLMPQGFRGLIVAALLAALMGTIAGALNSISTLFAYDLYKRFRPDTHEKKLVHIGRLATVVGIIVAIAWSPLIGKFSSIYEAIASMIAYIAPPITATFVVGILWKRATARAALITLWSGFAMGLVVFFLDFFKKKTHWDLGFMQAAGILCLICIVLITTISLLTKNTNSEENLKLVWDSPLTPFRIPGARGILNYKFLSVVVLIAVCTLYYIFRMPAKGKVEEWTAAHPQYAATIESHTKTPMIAPPKTAEKKPEQEEK
jgi:SSS family solute:Na+ symporter